MGTERCCVCGGEVNIGNSRPCDNCGGRYCTKKGGPICGSTTTVNRKGRLMWLCDTCAGTQPCSAKGCTEEYLKKCAKCRRPFCLEHLDAAGLCEQCRKKSGKFWLNTETGTRHAQNCRWFENTANGRMCKSKEGRACNRCGA